MNENQPKGGWIIFLNVIYAHNEILFGYEEVKSCHLWQHR
jgi:hypothetical protein